MPTRRVWRSLRIVPVVLMVFVPKHIRAQAPSGDPTVDSASVARAAWARAGQALRGGDMSEARSQIARAAHAWPVQPAYQWADAVLAARAHDTTATLAGLKRYVDLGVGHDLSQDSSMRKLVSLPAFSEVRRASEQNVRALVHSHTAATFSDSTFWPEGMDADPRTRHFYVGSIRHRTIAEVDASGASRDLWPRDQQAYGAIFGVRVDTMRNVLWATTSGLPQTDGYLPADSGIAALLQIRPSDGKLLHRWDLPIVSGGHALGDLAVSANGDVFVTDSNQPFLYRLRRGADTLEAITNPLFHSLQGVAPTPDGKLLFVADYSHGLLRVDLATGAVTRLADAPHSTSLGCDGIAWYRGTIIAVQNGINPARVVQFVLDRSLTRIARMNVLDQNVSVATEPTIGAISRGEFVYVANGQFNEYDANGKRVAGTVLVRPVLLAVPLPH